MHTTRITSETPILAANTIFVSLSLYKPGIRESGKQLHTACKTSWPAEWGAELSQGAGSILWSIRRLPDSPWRPVVSVQLRHMQLGEQLLEAGRSYRCFDTQKSGCFCAPRLSYPKPWSCASIASHQQQGCSGGALEREAEVDESHLFHVSTAINLMCFVLLGSAGGVVSSLFPLSLLLVSSAPCFQCLE